MTYELSIYTIGHSTHSMDEFIAMLRSFQITCLADIRSLPGSRKFPHFNKELLEVTLPAVGIQYIHIKDLGGRRKVRPDSTNIGWRLPAFRGYADYMETEDFDVAASFLEGLAREQRVAFMCAEAVWWRCHRGLVADWLKHRGWNVLHILGKGKAQEHPYTSPARIIEGKLMYNKLD